MTPPQDPARLPAVPLADIEALDPESRAFFDDMVARIGFAPNSIATNLHRPPIAKAIIGLVGAVYGPDSTLPAAAKSRLGLICSTINGCAYCTSHQCHAGKAPAAELSDSEVAALVSGADQGGDPVEAAMFAFARAASHDPGGVSEALLAQLRQVLSAPQLVELAAVVRMWKLLNCLHDSLHLTIEDHMQPYLQLAEAAG